MSIYPPENTLQKAAVAGGLFELYDLDLSTSVPGGYLPDFHFTPAAGADGVLPIRGGVAYRAVPVEISGFDQSTGGAPAQPTMKLGAATPLISGLLWQADDFVGAKLTRTIVCGVNLDGGADPDPAAYVLSDEFRVAQKTRHARDYLELRLISEIEMPGRQMPRRVALRDYCSRRYRTWDAGAGAWHYYNAPGQDGCPYTGAIKYDLYNQVTTNVLEDRCKKDLQACKLRFPNAALPTRALPGVGSGR